MKELAFVLAFCSLIAILAGCNEPDTISSVSSKEVATASTETPLPITVEVSSTMCSCDVFSKQLTSFQSGSYVSPPKLHSTPAVPSHIVSSTASLPNGLSQPPLLSVSCGEQVMWVQYGSSH